MSSPKSNSKDFVELTPSGRSTEYHQLNPSKVFDSELCMLALPADEQQMLMRVSQYLFCHCLIPVVVRSPTEALIHSRHSRFAVIILPDDDPTLIRKVRSFDGMNCGTPVIAISSAETLPEATQQLLNSHEIHSVVQRTPNAEKLEMDLINTLSTVIGQSPHNGDPCLQPLPFPLQNSWCPVPNHTRGPAALGPCHRPETSGLPGVHSGANPGGLSCMPFSGPGQTLVTNACQGPMDALKGVKAEQEQATQLQQGGVEMCTATPCGSEPVPQIMSQTVAPPNVSPSLESHAKEGLDVLPGIKTLLTAIRVVEGEAPATQQAPTQAEMSPALNFTDHAEGRASTRSRTRKVRRVSSDSQITSAGGIMSESEFESLHESSKSPMSVLAAKRPYFLALDHCREAMADDQTASPIDRHNAKERHRRVRITKAAEFFKAVIPCMDANMDKATAFHMTVYYMLFLRNALLRQDPNILPTLHQTYKEEWSEVFNMEDVAPDDN